MLSPGPQRRCGRSATVAKSGPVRGEHVALRDGLRGEIRRRRACGHALGFVDAVEIAAIEHHARARGEDELAHAGDLARGEQVVGAAHVPCRSTPRCDRTHSRARRNGRPHRIRRRPAPWASRLTISPLPFSMLDAGDLGGVRMHERDDRMACFIQAPDDRPPEEAAGAAYEHAHRSSFTSSCMLYFPVSRSDVACAPYHLHDMHGTRAMLRYVTFAFGVVAFALAPPARPAEFSGELPLRRLVPRRDSGRLAAGQLARPLSARP